MDMMKSDREERVGSVNDTNWDVMWTDLLLRR